MCSCCYLGNQKLKPFLFLYDIKVILQYTHSVKFYVAFVTFCSWNSSEECSVY